MIHRPVTFLFYVLVLYLTIAKGSSQNFIIIFLAASHVACVMSASSMLIFSLKETSEEMSCELDCVELKEGLHVWSTKPDS